MNFYGSKVAKFRSNIDGQTESLEDYLELEKSTIVDHEVNILVYVSCWVSVIQLYDDHDCLLASQFFLVQLAVRLIDCSNILFGIRGLIKSRMHHT